MDQNLETEVVFLRSWQILVINRLKEVFLSQFSGAILSLNPKKITTA